MQNIKPVADYCYAKKVVKDTGVVLGSDIRDTHQMFEIIAVGEGRYEHGTLIAPSVKTGDKVLVQKHAAEGDTPSDMLSTGYALFQSSRIMAVVEDGSDGN